ncbi:MAG: T9SS type A sorting domain-containing protein [Janthinobacterium lividum]
MKVFSPFLALFLPAALISGLADKAAARTTAAIALYVNDGATNGDVYTSAPGSDAAGDGSAAAPFATVARALAQADLTTQTIFIDTGTYSERIVLSKPVSLQGAGTANAQPASATIFDGGLLPAPTQTSEAGLLLTVSGGTNSQPLKIAGVTFRAYDFGIQSAGSGPQAYLVLEDVETVHNRRQGIFWNSISGVQHLTLRRVRAAYSAEAGNSTANSAGRGFFLTNGHKVDILVEDGEFAFNRRSGVDINDGSVSGLTVRNCQFQQNEEPALAVLGAAGARTADGSFTSIAALIEGNTIRTTSSSGLELKACTGTGQSSGPGSFVVRANRIARAAAAPTSLSADNAGVLFIDRDRNVIASGGGVTGDLITGGAFLANNTIRGYLADATSAASNNSGFGLVLEGTQNKVFGNVVAQCQQAIQVQDRPAGSTGATPFFDSSRNGLVVSSGDSIRGNRLDSCAVAIRAVNLTNPVDASLNWLGAATATTVRGTAGTGGSVVTLSGPSTGFAELSALAPTGLVDYSPFLNSAVDASAAIGFQPQLDYLNVDRGSPQSVGETPLAEGLALVAEDGTLRLEAGTYDESISLTKSLTLQNTGPTTLRDLTLAGASKVLTLGAPLTVTGTLTLTSGLVHTTAANLLTLADQATATAGNTASYVDGPLRKVGQQAFVFPLGKAGQWARLGISAPTDPTAAFTAEYVATPYPTRTAAAPLSEVSQVEYWTLAGDGPTNAVQVRLFWENAFRSGLDDFSADVQVAAFTGTQWETAGNGGLDGALGAGSVVSAQAVGTLGAFTLGSLSPTVNPLSTQLVGFVASQPRPSVVNLDWTLTDETTTYGYAVERSADRASWQQIGFVASQGPTTTRRTYTYQDQAVQGLTQAFYRLRQNTGAAATRYSAVAAVVLAGSPLATLAPTPSAFALFPNPASGQVTLRLPAKASGSVQVTLTDLSGRLVLTQTLPGSTEMAVRLPASVGAGIYLFQMQGAGFSSKPQRLVVQ